MKKKVIALMGKSGSGKDTILKEMVSRYPNIFHKIINTTTRPKRNNEVDGIDYYFVSEDEFKVKAASNGFLVSSVFNNWYYGTSFSCLQKNKLNIGVFSISDILKLQKNPNIELTVIYISASDRTRLLRSLNRELNPNIDEIIRRYLTDKEDFKLVSDICYDLVINDRLAIDQTVIEIYNILCQNQLITCE